MLRMWLLESKESVANVRVWREKMIKSKNKTDVSQWFKCRSNSCCSGSHSRSLVVLTGIVTVIGIVLQSLVVIWYSTRRDYDLIRLYAQLYYHIYTIDYFYLFLLRCWCGPFKVLPALSFDKNFLDWTSFFRMMTGFSCCGCQRNHHLSSGDHYP